MHRLDDAGLIAYWTNEVIAGRISEKRTASESKSSSVYQNIKTVSNAKLLKVDYALCFSDTKHLIHFL